MDHTPVCLLIKKSCQDTIFKLDILSCYSIKTVLFFMLNNLQALEIYEKDNPGDFFVLLLWNNDMKLMESGTVRGVTA